MLAPVLERNLLAIGAGEVLCCHRDEALRYAQGRGTHTEFLLQHGGRISSDKGVIGCGRAGLPLEGAQRVPDISAMTYVVSGGSTWSKTSSDC